MQIQITPATGNEPTNRVYSMYIIIRSFKGRKNVQAHLFRYGISSEDLSKFDPTGCIDTIEPTSSNKAYLSGSMEDTKHMVLESFTEKERDAVIQYLKKRYVSRLDFIEATPLSFPVPKGTMPLCSIPEGKSMGFIRFENMPGYPLPFSFRGFYDLDQHEPITYEPHTP
ncbi:MAG: hypothetical protein MI749_00480 [Desulfovibrionales bacterium]|nr:hypothetical protein [Desulfovibrionales bacterium]